MSTYQQKGDGWSFTASAQQFISGGMFVKAMSVAQVNATLSNLDVDQVDATTDRELTVGIAITNAASGERLSVATEGFFIAPAGGAITPVSVNVTPIGVAGAEDAVAVTAAGAGSYCGKALSVAASGENVLFKLILC